MKRKWFVALMMVVVMMCACWTGAGADEERETFNSGDYWYALLDDGTVEIMWYSSSAKKLTIADTLDGKKVTAIGDNAFHCNSLTSVIIPDSVAQIGVNPFETCSALKAISVSPDHPYFATIDGVLFRKADKTLISYPAGIKSSTYTIPQGIVSIGDSAFSYCSSLTNISIPDSVTSIGELAFFSCISLTSVSIPDSVTAIEDLAFSDCYSLTDLIIPASVTSIGYKAFAGCKFLKSVSIPDSVTYIGDSVFSGCYSFTLTVPRNSYAAEYAKTNNIPYTYPDVNDWLNN